MSVVSRGRWLRWSPLRLASSAFSSPSGSSPPGEGEQKVKALLEDAAGGEVGEEWATAPYPRGAVTRSQGHHSLRPRVDPRTTSVILFPGQGTQYVGMARHLTRFPSALDLFSEASELLKYDLLKLCLEGPKERLDKTRYAQPAIFVSSLAALERLKEEQPSAVENCVATAGFSLGELAALVFAGVIPFDRGVWLVKVRGEAMQLASDLNKGAMTNVLYGPDSNLGKACIKAKEYAEAKGVQNPYCGISNYLFPHCKIVAGHEEAIQFLERNKSEFKLRKMKRLPVSGAFHTPLMAPAIGPFREALSSVELSEPNMAVHSNVDGKFYTGVDHIVRQLPRQILAPVKWEQTLHILYERPPDVPFPRTFEVGPGKTLSTILKMVNAKAWGSCSNITA